MQSRRRNYAAILRAACADLTLVQAGKGPQIHHYRRHLRPGLHGLTQEATHRN
ncbi:hypothetical protein [Gordonia oryzae]|uniref:hypothetical protein n=1 Tax=Gordonia oryzae TaxID=2487349 RepID=UPI00160A0962|nr:hypothetical protein [Gordonia oryzae]